MHQISHQKSQFSHGFLKNGGITQIWPRAARRQRPLYSGIFLTICYLRSLRNWLTVYSALAICFPFICWRVCWHTVAHGHIQSQGSACWTQQLTNSSTRDRVYNACTRLSAGLGDLWRLLGGLQKGACDCKSISSFALHVQIPFPNSASLPCPFKFKLHTKLGGLCAFCFNDFSKFPFGADRKTALWFAPCPRSVPAPGGSGATVGIFWDGPCNFQYSSQWCTGNLLEFLYWWTKMGCFMSLKRTSQLVDCFWGELCDEQHLSQFKSHHYGTCRVSNNRREDRNGQLITIHLTFIQIDYVRCLT